MREPSPTPPHDQHSPLTLVQKNLPNWLHSASPDSFAALKTTPRAFPDWVKNASDTQHSRLKQAVDTHWKAFNSAEQQLSKILTPDAFAEPLLKDALKTFGLDLDVRNTYIRLYVPLTIPWFPIQTGASRVWAVSLLDAALHNFELSETMTGAYEEDSFYSTAPLTDEQYAGHYTELPDIKKKLSIEAFTSLCRSLDIGAKYEAFLRENLGFTEPVVDAVLRPLIRESHQTALIWALEQALAKKDIGQPLYNALRESLDTGSDIVVDGKTWSPYSLAMLDCNLTEIIIFGARVARSADFKAYAPSTPEGRIVVFIPDDLEHSLKEYASPSAFYTEMVGRLRALPFQQFLSRFISHKDRGAFFTALPAELDHKVFFPATPAQWQEPTLRPRLKMVSEEIVGSLWDYLFETQMSRRLDNGMDVAVSTARTDQKVRWRRWETFVTVIKTIAEIGAFAVAPFFPPLAAAILGYTAYQLLDEVFEGIIDWSLGLTTQAFEHLIGVTEAIAQLGGFVVGAPIISAAARAVLPAEVTAFFENLSQVKLKSGRSRLWNRDMRPYEHEFPLDNTSEPDDLGLYSHNNKKLLPIEGKHYAVEQDLETSRYQARHPTRDATYSPPVSHNGSGAWHHSAEDPLSWSGDKLVRRLNHENARLTPETIQHARLVSGIDDDALRKTHVNQESPPALLDDTLKRFQIDTGLQRFIEQLQAGDLTAEPHLQLQLLSSDSRWPTSKVLCFLDESGNTLMEYGNRQNPELPRIQIAEGQLRRGELLNTVLESLDEIETRALLGDRWVPDIPGRLIALRERMTQQAQLKKTELFESRYADYNRTDNGPAQLLQRQMRSLPATIATELVENATAPELEAMLAPKPKVPFRLLQEARYYLQETRLARAYEGIYLNPADTTDTDKLILHTAERLLGWSRQVRLEIRDGVFKGRLLDSIGAPDAPVRKVLVKQNGNYQVFDEQENSLHGLDNLYNSILHALPDTERAALEIPLTSQGDLLKQRILEHLPSRDDLRVLLNLQSVTPELKSPMLLAKGRVGYPASGRGSPAAAWSFASFKYRVKKLYPNLSAIDELSVMDELFRENGLVRREAEWEELQHTLDRWVNRATTSKNSPTELELHSRRDTAQRIRSCWQRNIPADTSEPYGWLLRLTPHDIEELPPLEASFKHVSVLEIHAGTPVNNIGVFVQHFPNVRRLFVKNCPLSRLPAVARNPGLKELHLEQCDLRLTQDDADILSNNAHLTFLNLEGNPLGAIPRLSKMSALEILDLSNTGINQVPSGLEQNLPNLTNVDLSNNQITYLPEALFEAPAAQAQGYDFSQNPLTQPSQQRIRDYYRKTGMDLGFPPEEELQRLRTVYPELTDEQLHHATRQLPRELSASLAELARLEGVYQALNSDLARWALETPPRAPYTNRPLSGAEIVDQQRKRIEFAEKIKACWRRDSSALDLNQPGRYQLELPEAIIGTLPTVGVDFKHVSALMLVSGGETIGTEDFLASFPSLVTLELEGFRLGTLPPRITQMSTLETLTLPECDIVLDEQNVGALKELRALTTLDLHSNPLDLAPDVSDMAQLRLLNLSDGEISEIPQGLFSLTQAHTVDLSSNQIREVPTHLIDVPYTQEVEYDLRDNPISTQSRLRLGEYFTRAREDAEQRNLFVEIQFILSDAVSDDSTGSAEEGSSDAMDISDNEHR